jgi:hypothetical protein
METAGGEGGNEQLHFYHLSSLIAHVTGQFLREIRQQLLKKKKKVVPAIPQLQIEWKQGGRWVINNCISNTFRLEHM